jgi:hypothetical protein
VPRRIARRELWRVLQSLRGLHQPLDRPGACLDVLREPHRLKGRVWWRMRSEHQPRRLRLWRCVHRGTGELRSRRHQRLREELGGGQEQLRCLRERVHDLGRSCPSDLRWQRVRPRLRLGLLQVFRTVLAEPELRQEQLRCLRARLFDPCQRLRLLLEWHLRLQLQRRVPQVRRQLRSNRRPQQLRRVWQLLPDVHRSRYRDDQFLQCLGPVLRHRLQPPPVPHHLLLSFPARMRAWANPERPWQVPVSASPRLI